MSLEVAIQRLAIQQREITCAMCSAPVMIILLLGSAYRVRPKKKGANNAEM
jgi:hypothetical protein